MQKRSFFLSFLHGWWLCTELCVGATSLCQDAWYRYAPVNNRRADTPSHTYNPVPFSIFDTFQQQRSKWEAGAPFTTEECVTGNSTGAVQRWKVGWWWKIRPWYPDLFSSLVTLVTKGLIGILSWYAGILSLHLIWNLKIKFPSQCLYQYSECWYSELICFLLMLSYSASNTAFPSYLKYTGDTTNILLNPCSGFDLCFRWIWVLISHLLGGYFNHCTLCYRTSSCIVNLFPSFLSFLSSPNQDVSAVLKNNF